MNDFAIRTDLMVRHIEGETVILDRKAELIHTLNPTASLIWEGLQRDRSVQDIVQSLVEAFEVETETAANDVAGVIANLRELGLLQAN